MSLHEYQVSQRISANDPPFYALIMAAFRKADTDNLGKLRCAFPVEWIEFEMRYHAPGGLLEGELPSSWGSLSDEELAAVCKEEPDGA